MENTRSPDSSGLGPGCFRRRLPHWGVVVVVVIVVVALTTAVRPFGVQAADIAKVLHAVSELALALLGAFAGAKAVVAVQRRTRRTRRA